MNGSQSGEGGVTLGLGLNVLNRHSFDFGICDGGAVAADHIGAAMFAGLDSGHNIIEEFLVGDKVHHTYDLTVGDAVPPHRSRNHDRQLTGDLADGGSGDPCLSLKGFLYIFSVGIVVAVEKADAGGIEQIAAGHVIVRHPGVHDFFLFSGGHSAVAELGHHTEGFYHIFIGCEFIGYAVGGQ